MEIKKSIRGILITDAVNKELDEGRRDGDFARIELDDAFLSIMTIGPIQDGWYAELLQIDREEPLNLCVDEDLYIEDCDPDCEGE